jgi:hypothetical protein
MTTIKKRNSLFTIMGLLIFFLLCLVPNGQAQQGTPLSYASAPAQLAISWTFNSTSPPTAGFTVNGLRYFQLIFVPAGTVSSCGISLDSSTGSGYSTGGIIAAGTIGSCASATSYSNSSPTNPTLLGQLTPTITGSGSVTAVLLGYVNNPSAAGSSSAAITSPLDGSGFVNVHCQTGCTGGNPNGQAAMASSSPVVIASNQSAIPATTQPTGFGALVQFQQAVTASAVALSSNATHQFCVKALPTNALAVYVGGSGETTSTGYPLQPGDWICYQLSNSNLVYVIASSTGSSVAVTGN